MYKQERIKPYGDGGEKKEQVEQMFDTIAPTYDKLNHRLSWDIDKIWRRKAVRQLMSDRPQHILDVATGTGDFAILAASKLHPVHLTGVDISEGMMDIGRMKARHAGLGGVIDFSRQDCTEMSFDDNSFDAVISAFGIRNFQDLDKGLREMCRVLKPGGHLSIVELSAPKRFPMKQLFHIYSHTFLPSYGRIISGDSKAYDYLTATIEAFPQGEQMMEILRKAGFRRASFRRLTFGICTMFYAEK
ncbi:MAG: bifunctional demethylmenaquinone methyltransferase/2-methoxy-6-polyprenyl-1,4-benzoquinol methylase UbiE [Prevotella sp.]|nr:bifunctional demethylmenaquinone methyltransferase/2-methoxy-6-polyprenyl-1,4-benzoquinol methylase UbiE [Prevotella sp.]